MKLFLIIINQSIKYCLKSKTKNKNKLLFSQQNKSEVNISEQHVVNSQIVVNSYVVSGVPFSQSVVPIVGTTLSFFWRFPSILTIVSVFD